MTDEEFIQLVKDKAPDELSPQQIVSLRQRLLQSESLRDVIFGELKLEGYVVEALDRIELSADDLVDRKALDRRNSRFPVWKITIAVLVVVSLVGIVVVNRGLGPQTSEVVETPEEDEKGGEGEEADDEETDPGDAEVRNNSPEETGKGDSPSNDAESETNDPPKPIPPKPIHQRRSNSRLPSLGKLS